MPNQMLYWQMERQVSLGEIANDLNARVKSQTPIAFIL
jgi:hypothetical protein